MGYIEFKNVDKYFGDNHVLKDISLDIDKGCLVTLLGPSGCGKSTLLRCLAGLTDITQGKVFMDGSDITDVSPRDRGIGMVFQQYSLFPNMTAAGNIAFGLTMKKKSKNEIDDAVKEILEIVGLSDRGDSYPSELSGGQQQRVALARAIVTEPKVLLLDEPLSAIDAKLRRSLQIEIRRLQKKFNMTTIFVTHDQEEAMVMSDQIHLFNEGCIEQSGTPIELYTHPVSKFAAGFIGNYNILSSDDFKKICGEAVDSKDVAIRPEVVRINLTGVDESQRYIIDGEIVNSISHGNLIRYTVDCGGISIHTDRMFEESSLLNIGEKVRLSIRKTNVVPL